MFKVVCCVCGKHMKGNPKATTISHSYCPKCAAAENKKIDEYIEKRKGKK